MRNISMRSIFVKYIKFGGEEMEDANESMEVITLIKEVMSLMKQSMSKGFENEGMTMPQGMVIGTLSRLGKMKINELSKHLGLSNSTISGIIDRLEKQETVERIRSDEDKRVVYVSLSAKFESQHQNFHKKMEESVRNIMNKGTPEEKHKIIEGFAMLKELLVRK
jgi:MarR family transcriptional regulator, organic hydroperoxide resistance regulator